MALVRLSPGVYRDSVTGKTVNNAAMPKPLATKPVASTPAQPAVTPTLEGLQGQRQKTVQAIQNKGGKQMAPGYTARLGELDKQIRGLRSAPPPPTTAQAPAGNAMGVPASNQAPQTAGPSYMDTSNPVWDMLFKPTKGFEENADYVRAKEKGMRDLASMMSARGLVGSGAEATTNAEFLSGLNAAEEKRVNEYNNIGADRLNNILQNQAALGEQARGTNLNFLTDLLSIGAGQNPSQIGAGAAGSTADLIMDDTKNKSGYIADNYKRAYSGGGGAAPYYVPPTQTTMPTNGSSILGEVMDYNANQSGLNSIIGGLGGLFNALRR